MAWQEPKTDWKPSDALTSADMNRIEENTKELKNALDGIGLQNGLIEVEHTDIKAKTEIKKDGHKIYDTSGSNPVQIGGTMTVNGKTRTASNILFDPESPGARARVDGVEGEIIIEKDGETYTAAVNVANGLMLSNDSTGNYVAHTVTHYSYFEPGKGWINYDGASMYAEYNGSVAAININPLTGKASLYVTTPGGIGGGDLWHTGDLKIISSTVITSGSITFFDYPTGFNRGNTIVLAVKVDNGSVVRNVVPNEIEYFDSYIQMTSSYFEAGNKVQVAIIKA